MSNASPTHADVREASPGHGRLLESVPAVDEHPDLCPGEPLEVEVIERLVCRDEDDRIDRLLRRLDGRFLGNVWVVGLDRHAILVREPPRHRSVRCVPRVGDLRLERPAEEEHS